MRTTVHFGKILRIEGFDGGSEISDFPKILTIDFDRLNIEELKEIKNFINLRIYEIQRNPSFNHLNHQDNWPKNNPCPKCGNFTNIISEKLID